MGPSHCQLSIAAPAWTDADVLSSERGLNARLRPAPRRDGGLPVALLASAAAHALAAATLGTALLSETPAPRGDGNPVQPLMSVTVTAPPAPALPRVAPPPDPQPKRPAPFQPPSAITPRVIVTRANASVPPAFTVPAPKPMFVTNAPLLPVADRPPAQPAASVGGHVGNLATHAGPTNGVAQAVAVIRARPDYAHNPPPAYPQSARLRGWQGTVVLSVEVLPDGRAGEVGVARSSGRRVLDDAALQAVRGWRFLPARVNQDSIRSLVEIPVSFRLTNS